MSEEIKEVVETMEETDEKEYFEKLNQGINMVIHRILDCSYKVTHQDPSEHTIKDTYGLGKEVRSIVDDLEELYGSDLSEQDENDTVIIIEELMAFLSHLYLRCSDSVVRDLEDCRLGDDVFHFNFKG